MWWGAREVGPEGTPLKRPWLVHDIFASSTCGVWEGRGEVVNYSSFDLVEGHVLTMEGNSIVI